MHAYLLVGRNEEAIEVKVNHLVRQFGSERVDLPLQKIADVRDLEKFSRLQLNKPTTIVMDVNGATTPAFNAFLKSLEEPQENLSYILITKSTQNVLPTIISRCQVIKVKGGGGGVKGEFAEKFLSKSKGGMLLSLDSVKKREDAVEFLEQLILSGHKGVEKKVYASALSSALITLKNIQANGNVTLQMANFVANL